MCNSDPPLGLCGGWKQKGLLTLQMLLGSGGIWLAGAMPIEASSHLYTKGLAVSHPLELAQESNAVPLSPETVPQAVVDAVLDAIATDFQEERSQLQISSSEPRLWSDGCLGLGPIGMVCQEILVVGWQVTVIRDRKHWVYRTNNSGKLIQWDQAGSSLRRFFTFNSTTMGTDQPMALPKKALFRSLVRVGEQFSQETILFKDGQLWQRELGTEQPPAQQTTILPRTTVKQFRRFLSAQKFQQFDQRCFTPTSKAKAITIFLSSQQTDVCYDGNSNLSQLPTDLRRVIHQWRGLTASTSP